MAWETVAQGGVIDLYSGMQQYGYLIPEGNRALFQLNLRTPVSSTITKQIENELKARGVPGVKVVRGSPVLKIYFQKTFWWLPVIVAAILFLAILIVSWLLFKETGPVIGTGIMIGLGILAGLIILKPITKGG